MVFIGGNGKEAIRINGNTEIFATDVDTQPIGGILSNILEIVDKVQRIKEEFEFDVSSESLKKTLSTERGIDVSKDADGRLVKATLDEIMSAIKAASSQPSFHHALIPYVIKNGASIVNCALLEVNNYMEMCAKNFEYLSGEYLVNLFQYLNAHGIHNCQYPIPVGKLCDEALNERRYLEKTTLYDDIQQLSEDMGVYHIYRFYDCKDLIDICAASINELILQHFLYAKCIHCRRMFVPPRANALYCDKQAPESNKASCRMYCKNQREMKVLQNQESRGLLRKTHIKLRNRTIRYPENKEYQAAFTEFVNKSGKLGKLVEIGELTQEAFTEWLRKQHQG
jgi:hypothetical protein